MYHIVRMLFDETQKSKKRTRMITKNKNSGWFLLSLVLAVMLIGCPNPVGDGKKPEGTPPPEKFHALQFDSSGRQTNIIITAHLIKSTDHLDIYLRENQEMDDKDIDYIANNFNKL